VYADPSESAGRSYRSTATTARCAHPQGSQSVVIPSHSVSRFCTGADLQPVGASLPCPGARVPLPGCAAGRARRAHVCPYPPQHYDPTRITVSGFSAGANLAMVLAVTHSADPSLPPVRAVASLYGNSFIDAPRPPAPSPTFDDGTVVRPAIRAWLYKCYLLPDQDRSALGLSPDHAPIDAYPERVLVTCGEADDLHGPGRRLVDWLQGGGHGGAEFVGVTRGAHAFDKGARTDTLRAKRDGVYARVGAMMREAGK